VITHAVGWLVLGWLKRLETGTWLSKRCPSPPFGGKEEISAGGCLFAGFRCFYYQDACLPGKILLIYKNQ